MQTTTTSEFVAITSDHLEGQGWIVPASYLRIMDTDEDPGVDNVPGAVEFWWIEDETREPYETSLRAAGFRLEGTVAQNVDAVSAL